MPHLSSFSRHLTSIALAGAIAATGQIAFVAHPAFAQATVAPGNQSRNFLAADIETAEYTSGDLPPGQSALTAKVQILLDRAGISPGVVDGWRGGMSESAIKAYQRRANLPMDGRMSPVVWQLLQPFASEALTMDYTITEDDAHGLVDNIPSDYAEKAKMTSQGFTSISEKLAERFHMDEKFLIKLNPGRKFEPGVTIKATVPAKPIRATVTRIIVDKATRRVAAYDAKGNMVADYPATVGSTSTPSPHGTHTVDAVALNPTYTYNPNKNFKQGNNDRVLIVPPGPNGPVGEVWIDLSEPTYGIHGTATPSRLFVNQSYGCVRLTNWDARELAHMVKAKVTTVEFLEPGVSIADVTGGAAAAGANKTTAATTVASAISAIRPPARPQSLAINNTAPQSGTTVANGAAPSVTPGPAGIAATPTTAAAGPGGAAQTGGAPVVAGDDLLSEAIAEAVSVNEPVTSAVLPAAGTAAAAIAPTLPPRRSTTAAKLPADPTAPAQTPQPTTPQAAAAGIAPLVTTPLPAGN